MFERNSDSQLLAQTYELGQARLRLRTDLKYTLHNDSASPWYLIEDESNGRYFRVGITEYVLLSLFNGRRTLDEAIAKLASLPHCDDLSEEEVASLARWVIDSGLAETSAAKSRGRIDDLRERELVQQAMQWLNPVAIRIPLFNPDRLLARLYEACRFVAGWPMLLVWLLVFFAGAMTFMMEAESFWRHQIQSISGVDFLWLGVSWLLLKMLHETAHGMMCKHYGGRTSQFGLLLLLMVPLPYVDVSSSWRFATKSQRILTAAAGMLIEAFIAAIAIMVWAKCSPGPVQYHAGNLFLAATVNTLLFNGNPLMKFDGYYMLVDWLEIPNLYTRGRSFVKSWMKWAFFGTPFQMKTEPSPTKNRIVRIYGVLAFIWLALIYVSLGAAALNMFNGVGLLIAMLAWVLWIGLPVVQLVRYLATRHTTENPSRCRFYVLTFSMAAVLYAVFTLVPAPESISAPAVVVNDKVVEVRTRSAGFVKSILVSDGDVVAEGEVLVELDNPELLADVARMNSEIAASELKASVYKNNGDLATWQMEMETCEGLKKQRSELEEQRRQLQVLAPAAGVVNSANLGEFESVYLEEGEELLSIIQSEAKQVVAMLTQQDAVWLRLRDTSCKVSISFYGSTRGKIEGKVVEISPRATNRVPHFAFASTNGGPLSVVPRRQVDVEVEPGASPMRLRSANLRARRSQSLVHFASHHSDDDEQLKLIQQYVPVVVEINRADASGLRNGQSGVVSIGGRQTTLGDYLYHRVKRWVISKIQLTHGI